MRRSSRRSSPALLAALLLLACSPARSALPAACYEPALPCAASDPQSSDACFQLCAWCGGDLFFGLLSSGGSGLCSAPASARTADAIASALTAAFVNISDLQGLHFLDGPGNPEENATLAVAYLLRYMPRRDTMLLAAHPFEFLEFVFEHVRYALQTRAWSARLGVPWQTFLQYVVPYGILNEKRDLWFRWRPRFQQLLLPLVAGAANTSEAAQIVAAALPSAFAQGALALDANGSAALAAGAPVTWHSETSPGYISVQQVVQLGGSCTGTGILMVAASRAVGIPARLAGCPESVVRGDDHKWQEIYDPTSPGPFGDSWHTREGTSRGNAGGPWDAPSGPMLGCLAGVVPGSAMDTLWASSWDAPDVLPTLWSNDSWHSTWSRVGGINRCGAYCTAWGCGPGNANKWTQAECGPA